MKQTYQISLEDFSKAQRLHSKQPVWLTILSIAGLSVLMMGAVMGLSNGQLSLFPLLTLFIVPIFYVIFRFIIAPRNNKRIYDQQTELHTQIELEISPSELVVSQDQAYRQYAWKDFLKFKEDKDTLILYTADITFVPIPKKQCSDAFLGEIKQYLEAITPIEKPKVNRTCLIYLILFIVAVILILLTTYNLK